MGHLMSMVLLTLVMALRLCTAQIDPSSYPDLERTISFSFYLAAAVCLPGLFLSVIRGRVHGID